MEDWIEQPKHASRAEWEHLKKFGYAPGEYMSRCGGCSQRVVGIDKRAVRCFACATKMFEDEQDMLATYDLLHEAQIICEQVGHGPEDQKEILASLMEEVGETAVEIKIKHGLKDPSKGGDDGIVGEAVDVILCSLDIIYSELGSLTDPELKLIFANKLNKWRRSVA